MNYFAVSGLVNGVVSVVCGTIIFLQNPGSRKNRIFALFCASLAIWAFFYFLWQIADNSQAALFYSRALMMGAIIIPVLGFHQIISILDMETPWRRKLLSFVAYPLSFVFMMFNFSPLFVKAVEQKIFFPYWPMPGPVFHVYILFFAVLFTEIFRTLWILRRKSPPNLRNQIDWITLATAVGWFGGSTNFLLWYDIPVPPYTNILLSLYVLIISLLYFQLGLIDVKSVLKHISVVLLIQLSLLGITLPALIPLARYALNHPGTNLVTAFVLFAVVIGLVLSIGPFVYAYLTRNSYWLKGHLSTGLAHELKSPLGTIQSALEALSEGGGLSPSKRKDYLDMVQRNVNRLEAYVQDLLNLAKIQSDDVNLQKTTFNLTQLVKDTVEAKRTPAEQKGLALSINLVQNIDVEGDRPKLQQVISNLISNAINFSARGTIAVHLSQTGGEIKFSIRDQGIGLDKKHLGKIFDRFYQASPNSKGSGIGLAIAKAWVEAHHGKIWAESEGEGKGTTISFTLPI